MIMRKLGRLLAIGFGGLLLLVLLAMLGVKLALDRAPRYQAEIKEWLHAQTGYPIAFAHVSPAFRWYGPELYFERLELRSKDDQRVLARAAGGRVAADMWQLIRSGKVLAGRIEVCSPNLVVARLGPTRFAVASEIELGGDNSSRASRQLGALPAGRLVIRGATLTMENWNAALPQLTLEGVDIDAQHDAGELTLRFSGRMPAALGGSVNFEGHARGGGEAQSLAWDGRLRARDVLFPGWRRLLPEYLSKLDSGAGAFDVSANGQGATLGAPWRMHMQAKFQHAGYASVQGVPGLRGISGSITGNESGGQIAIDTRAGVFHWPAQFPRPVDLERLRANIYWKRTGQELLIASRDWEIKTRDAEILGQVAWHQPSDESAPVLTLVGVIQNGNAGNARNYLPNGLIGPGALAWLNDAFVAGRLHANILFQGPVRSFPFRGGGGIFLARCSIEGMTLNYSPGWAPAENLAASAEFRNE